MTEYNRANFMGLPLRCTLRILLEGPHVADVMGRGGGREGWAYLLNHYHWWIGL